MTSRKRVYAESTKVPVEKSHGDVHKMLTDLGAEQIGIMHSGDSSIIVFKVNDAMYKFDQPKLPDLKDENQAKRAAWRALVLLVKAKKVAIEQGISTIEREFMPDTVMPDGSTLEEHRDRLIEHNYKDGPPQLGFVRH